jgi:endonuclease YncB( thermonuclease family)
MVVQLVGSQSRAISYRFDSCILRQTMKDLLKILEELTYKFYGTVVKEHDGDTVTIDIDLGFSVHTIQNIRIAGINAPELSTPEGKLSRDYIQKILPIGTKVVLHTEKYRESFTRYIGDIYLDDGRNVGQMMIDAGFAVVYKDK